MYANRTDLADFYRGGLTLRQILIRIQAMPPDAPIHVLMDNLERDAAEKRDLAEHDAALAIFNRG